MLTGQEQPASLPEPGPLPQRPWPRLSRRPRPACGAGALARTWAPWRRSSRPAPSGGGQRHDRRARSQVLAADATEGGRLSSAQTRSAGTSSGSSARPPPSSRVESTRHGQAGRPYGRTAGPISGTGGAGLRAGMLAASAPRSRSSRSLMTWRKASKKMPPLIFETPSRRSTKMNGTCAMRACSRWARSTSSIMKT